MYHCFIEFIFEKVLFDWKDLLEVIQSQFSHMHDGPNIELIDPVGDFVHP